MMLFLLLDVDHMLCFSIFSLIGHFLLSSGLSLNALTFFDFRARLAVRRTVQWKVEFDTSFPSARSNTAHIIGRTSFDVSTFAHFAIITTRHFFELS
jgi:hypothetical protein